MSNKALRISMWLHFVLFIILAFVLNNPAFLILNLIMAGVCLSGEG